MILPYCPQNASIVHTPVLKVRRETVTSTSLPFSLGKADTDLPAEFWAWILLSRGCQMSQYASKKWLGSWASLFNAVYHCSSPKAASLTLFSGEKGRAHGHNSITDENTPNHHIKLHNSVHITLSFKASKYGKGFEWNLIHFYFVDKKIEGLGHWLSEPR